MKTASIAATGISGIEQVAGVDAISPEIHAALPVVNANGVSLNTVIRGITPGAFLVHREVVLEEGRIPDPGADEIILGHLAARNLEATAIGTTLQIDERPFEVVGIVSADGGVVEGEIWMPLTDVLVITQRDTLSCVVLRRRDDSMSSAQGFAATRLDLELAAIREDQYFAGLSAFFEPVRLMVIATAILVAAGGVVGGLNTTYAAFASRVREIGTLRTLGYSRIAVVRTLIEESILMASIGGLIAAVLGRVLFDGLTVRFSMGAFGLEVGANEIALGLIAGLILGVAGAMIPAYRCLRLPIPEALRAAT